MTYQEEEQSRLRRQASKEAITLALQGQWKEAVAINLSLIEKFPSDVEALNRLGRAYMELGEYKDAEAAYRKTLAVDQYNGIAQKKSAAAFLSEKDQNLRGYQNPQTGTAAIYRRNRQSRRGAVKYFGKTGCPRPHGSRRFS